MLKYVKSDMRKAAKLQTCKPSLRTFISKNVDFLGKTMHKLWLLCGKVHNRFKIFISFSVIYIIVINLSSVISPPWSVKHLLIAFPLPLY